MPKKGGPGQVTVGEFNTCCGGGGGKGGGLLRKGKNPSKKIGRGHVGSVRRGLDFLEIYHMIKWRVS